jgi:hypothetical protein
MRLGAWTHPVLTTSQLKQFATPRTWADIKRLQPRRSTRWWLQALIDADTFGFGLLQWDRRLDVTGVERSRRGAWVLTDKGREYVERRRPLAIEEGAR